MEFKHDIDIQALFLFHILHYMRFENYNEELNAKLNDLYEYLSDILYKDIENIPNDILAHKYTETIIFDK